ncbi:speckle-type POZ protein B-like [Microplitis mediator]|uniref:speckle-type POZ protein B-like n=1 Tax=Microplitis mediator TaxID=375433 RepID=UPI0025564BC7|nr:speckle-type POZ protein B-like [Microplitis mediator]
MEILCNSYSQKHKVINKWKIDQIIPFIESSENSDERTVKLVSPYFTINDETKSSWHLDLRRLEEKGWLSLFLFRNDGNDKVRIRFSLFILDNKNERKFFKTSCHHRDFSEGRGNLKFLEIKQLLDNKDDFLPNNALTVCAELTVYDDYKSFATEFLLQTPQRHMTDDFKELYDSKSNSDVILVVGNEKFKAHKLILSTRSPVFSAMFTHEMKENRESGVTIPDIDPEIFNKMLEFIYTDEINNLDADAAYLLEAADKYQLLNLKSLCEESLSKSCSIDNAIKLMILADLHNANQLLEFIFEFMIKKYQRYY